MKTRILLTGAAGFIGSHVVEHLLKNTDWDLILLDKLTYASNGLSRLADIIVFHELGKNRVQFYSVDISHPIPVGLAKEIGSVDYVVHMAAETHVDNSIANPRPFVEANVIGTFEMLQFARRLSSLKKFVYFSTDEVFGPACVMKKFHEWERYNSSNPYSATKAAGEELCLAWANTYKVPVVITHCMNNYGERQHPEKFIPTIVRKLLAGEQITIHCDEQNNSGARSYIHCRNTADAVLFLLQNNHIQLRDKFNIVGEQEVSNLGLVVMVKKIMDKILKRDHKADVFMTNNHAQRPGHDLRYALDGSKLKLLGWEPPKTFEDSLEKTVQWMIDPANIHWLMLEKEAAYV